MTRTRRAYPVVLLAIALTLGLVVPAHAKPNKPQPPPEPEAACQTVTSLSGNGGLQVECVWVPDQIEGVSVGTVTVVATGDVAYLSIAVRDSTPGDYCYLGNWDRPASTTFTAAFDLVRGAETYWSSPANWCGDRTDLDGAPLTVSVYARVKKGVALTVTLTPGQSG